MPFEPGEMVDLRFIGNPDTAVFHFEGQRLTVANGGLDERRKSALHAIFRLPRQPGKYAYEFETDGEITARGHLRVEGGASQRRGKRPEPRPEPATTGVRARRL